jgi:Holliday junction DNA helicase RuvA
MIRLISGIVASSTTTGVVVVVGGLGYFIRTSTKTALLPNDPVTLHTYLAVRENALDLYGFLTETELICFELLLTIPKIGPKSALQILDQATVALIIEAVNLADAAHLTRLSGISKKTAEKIVAELKDKVNPLMLTVTATTPNRHTESYTDAFDTLLTLGYNPVNVQRVLAELNAGETTSTLVRQALQKLS